MAGKWKSALKAYPIKWLLEEENPPVRYFALKDLMDDKTDESELSAAKAAIPSYDKVQRIFARQKPEGFWESSEQPYLPKYKTTYWQIMILSQMGLDKGDERINKACDFISRFQLEEGGFTTNERTAEEAYKRKGRQELKKGKETLEYEKYVRDTIREFELTCLTGNMISALIRLGYDDERIDRAIKWLVEVQNRDGGWLCPYWKAHLRDKHGCFMGTIAPLDAFSVLPEKKRTSNIKESMERGAEFLLMHRLFRADHHDFKVINGSWLRLSFPCFFYDVLRGLDVVTRLGFARDERIDEAVDLLLEKQGSDSKWILERAPFKMQVDLEKKGQPSKWVTLNALRVMKRVYEARES